MDTFNFDGHPVLKFFGELNPFCRLYRLIDTHADAAPLEWQTPLARLAAPAASGDADVGGVQTPVSPVLLALRESARVRRAIWGALADTSVPATPSTAAAASVEAVARTLQHPIADPWRADGAAAHHQHVSPRKVAETDRVADAVRRLCLGAGATGVVEVGGGRGHLGEVLAHTFRLPCLSMDGDHGRQGDGAARYATHRNRANAPSRQRRHQLGRTPAAASALHQRAPLTPRPSLLRRESFWFPSDFHQRVFHSGGGTRRRAVAVESATGENRAVCDASPSSGGWRDGIPAAVVTALRRPCVVTGLHTCGPLADTAAALAVASGAAGLALVPCCAHLLSRSATPARTPDDASANGDHNTNTSPKPRTFQYVPRSRAGAAVGMDTWVTRTALALANQQHWVLRVGAVVAGSRLTTGARGGSEDGFAAFASQLSYAVALAILAEACDTSVPPTPAVADARSVLQALGVSDAKAAFAAMKQQQQRSEPRSRRDSASFSREGGLASTPRALGRHTMLPQKVLRRYGLGDPATAFSAHVRQWARLAEQGNNNEGGATVGLPDATLDAFFRHPAVATHVAAAVADKAVADALVAWAVEWAVALDRACGLAERGYAVFAGPVLSPAISARHVGILAVRDAGQLLLDA